MTDDPRSQSRWQSLRGVLTATAGMITAVAGLIAALYRILAAQLERRNTETSTLRFTVRMTTAGRYLADFRDETFRLVVDGAPRAPVSNLNTLVQAASAEEGDVEFVVPVATQTVVLQVRSSEEATEIPVALS